MNGGMIALDTGGGDVMVVKSRDEDGTVCEDRLIM
jgi:hypothetical protein